MDTKDTIVAASESLFDRHGFTATGMDRLTAAADVSSRTLYKHLGGKTDLIAATLERRRRRFFDNLNVDSVDALFRALSEWTDAEGARGCYFLRALSDAGDDQSEIRDAVTAYRSGLRRLIDRLVLKETGATRHADAVHVLFEGAVAAASYRGAGAIEAARQTAVLLIGSQIEPSED